jgi:sulfate adenylyltransferase subunit 1 (EFTu-like GTPase family)
MEKRVFMKILQYLAYNRLDLVKFFWCQNYDAIHDIYKALHKEFGMEFSL